MFKNSDRLAFLILVIVIIAGSYLYIQNKNAEATPLQEVKVGVKDAATGDVLVNIADKEGYFKKEGIKIKLVSAPNNVTALLSSGEVDITSQLVSATLLPFLNNENVKLIGITEKYTNNFGVSKYGPDEYSKIKKVGVPRIGGALHHTVLVVLENMGVNTKDVKFVNTGGTSVASIGLIEKGEIDFALVDQTDLGKLTGEKYTFIAPKDLYGSKVVPTGIITSENMISQKQAATQGYVNAIIRAKKFFDSNKADSLAYLNTGDYTAEMLDDMYNGIKESMNIDFVPKQEMLDSVLPVVINQASPKNPSRDLGEMIYSDFAEKATKRLNY